MTYARIIWQDHRVAIQEIWIASGKFKATGRFTHLDKHSVRLIALLVLLVLLLLSLLLSVLLFLLLCIRAFVDIHRLTSGCISLPSADLAVLTDCVCCLCLANY